MKKNIKTEYGSFTGITDDAGIDIFKGIPYAEQPVGKKRWLPAEPLQKSDSEYECLDFGSTAVQGVDEVEEASLFPQGEDCLTLNIWNRYADGKKLKPVMVFIHGGSYMAGGTTDPMYDGYNFAADNDVVMVTINYRLNLLGFVSFVEIGGPKYKDSGYLGILDQVTALEWIRDNIEYFGGDPSNVTIFGESCGGGSVSLLMTVPRAKGLFNKVIAQSGSLILRKSTDLARRIGSDYMKKMNCRSMEDLLKLSTSQIQDSIDEFQLDYGFKSGIMFAPEANDECIPRDPFAALESGCAGDVKLIIGTNADEWNYWKLYFDDFDSKMPAFLADQLFVMGVVLHYEGEIAEQYLRYRTEKGMTENNIAFTNEALFRIPAIKMAEIQSRFNDTWMYYFTWKSAIPGLGACHAIELPFIFNTMDSKGSKDFAGPNPPATLAELAQKTWVAFAATGNPDNKLIPHWETYSADKRATMIIDEKWRVENDPESESRKITEQLYAGI